MYMLADINYDVIIVIDSVCFRQLIYTFVANNAFINTKMTGI